MRRATVAILVWALAAGAAPAQLLPGPPANPQAPFEGKPDCSEAGVAAIQKELDQLEAIEKSAPATIALVCEGVRAFSDWMGWKDNEPLPGAVNDIAKQLLHQDLTPRMVKAMCQQAQGEAMRNFRTEIGRLKDRLAGCKGI